MEEDAIRKYIEEGIAARDSLDPSLILKTGLRIAEAFLSGHKLILMGNGGSAADSQHIAAEFVGRFETERDPLPALALNVNTSSITAISNDYSYDDVFERQIRAFAGNGDIVVGISTSGNSRNVAIALKTARERGCYTIALTGSSDGLVSNHSDEVIHVQSRRTSIIQEIHISIGHMWSKIVEDKIFEK